MGKVILVIDEPKNCINCKLQDWAICRFTKKCHTGATRPDWCPLKTPPKKQELTFIEPGQDAITLGWNACIDEIMEEKK